MAEGGYESDYEGRFSDEEALELSSKKSATFQCVICLENVKRTHSLLHKQKDKLNICNSDVCWECYKKYIQEQVKHQQCEVEIFPRCVCCRGRLVSYVDVDENKVYDISSFFVPSQDYILETLGRKFGAMIFMLDHKFAVAFDGHDMADRLRRSVPSTSTMRLDEFVDKRLNEFVDDTSWPTIDTVYQSLNQQAELEAIVLSAKLIGTIFQPDVCRQTGYYNA